MNNKTVFVVTQGSYSDYHVCCVCSTEEKAQEAVRLYVDSDYYSCELNDMPNHPDGLYPYMVKMDALGNVNSTNPIDAGYADTNKIYAYAGIWQFKVWAKDEEHAIKIANERRTALAIEGLLDKNEDWANKILSDREKNERDEK